MRSHNSLTDASGGVLTRTLGGCRCFANAPAASEVSPATSNTITSRGFSGSHSHDVPAKNDEIAVEGPVAYAEVGAGFGQAETVRRLKALAQEGRPLADDQKLEDLLRARAQASVVPAPRAAEALRPFTLAVSRSSHST